MNNKLILDVDDDQLEYADPGQRRDTPLKAWRAHKPKRSKGEVRDSLQERPPAQAGVPLPHLGLSPAFNVTNEERAYIVEQLQPFHQARQITSILRRVKGGKEANVYCCLGHPETGLRLVAAKIYRPRQFRNLRNDSIYRQGRPVLTGNGDPVDPRDWRAQKAIASKSGFGLRLQQISWSEYEFQALRRLYDAGGDVPRPLQNGEHVLLMEYLGEETVPAPTLHLVELERAEAHALFEQLVENVALMLAHDLVHGDLSAYNVMYWEGEIRIIDFPQVVVIPHNPDAYALFRRDVARLAGYFGRYGLRRDPEDLARQLWRRYLNCELPRERTRA